MVSDGVMRVRMRTALLHPTRGCDASESALAAAENLAFEHLFRDVNARRRGVVVKKIGGY